MASPKVIYLYIKNALQVNQKKENYARKSHNNQKYSTISLIDQKTTATRLIIKINLTIIRNIRPLV